MPHNCRCNKCKSVIYAMLMKTYGECELKTKFEGISVRLNDYDGSRNYRALCKIYKALINYRRNSKFVHSKTLNRSDLYIPSKKILFETDEAQHFTETRLIALKNYPKVFDFSYDVKAYKQMCKILDSRDSDPIYRDEQRAWYDTIRDFLPRLCPEKVSKVIRIPLGEYEWCSLDPNNPSDVRKFKRLLKAEDIWRK